MPEDTAFLPLCNTEHVLQHLKFFLSYSDAPISMFELCNPWDDVFYFPITRFIPNDQFVLTSPQYKRYCEVLPLWAFSSWGRHQEIHWDPVSCRQWSCTTTNKKAEERCPPWKEPHADPFATNDD
jgi:hypothetical protein